MKVRQLRKRKPVPPMAWLQSHIRRQMLCLIRGKGLRNDAAGRAAIARMIARTLPPPVRRIVITVPLVT